ncbi:type I-Fv CRISPR-associated protein Cas5fv [Paraglaciecola aquimarina]|uniref:Type I-Fv CRISPR-associated protein Cas5fv n=1 Tax=Paraglaciecola aquimarina TaxID=1235557 RepID=A0ABU3T0J4_9ALTE|nr:type I-Fv CRISPR-associated protein Cas5fv [Paraglaciecola aquimarina]MDU0355786.1 type I-Fv CRISPR-associated protein Cas5fv [Paraglaciecola aquimarina]
MKIEIKYESSWRNSFLDGSNGEPLPKAGRKFVASMRGLKNSDNYKPRKVEHNTVMGILNRLIGDQRKLYQSRNSDAYYFKQLEPLVTFEDKPSYVNREMTYVRNISGSEDQNSYTGMIKVDDPIFTSDYSQYLWGVLQLDIDELCDFILHDRKVVKTIEHNPLIIIARLEELFKLKPVLNESRVNDAFNYLMSKFEKFKGINTKGEVTLISFYCSALYLQLERLSKSFDVSSAKTKAGGLSGISNNGFTKKDFMSRYTSGEKKRIWGNPYIRKERIKGIGEVTSLMEKAGGTLNINISIDRKLGKELLEMIENAGVSSFYLGKKGLAYVSDIRV